METPYGNFRITDETKEVKMYQPVKGGSGKRYITAFWNFLSAVRNSLEPSRLQSGEGRQVPFPGNATS